VACASSSAAPAGRAWGPPLGPLDATVVPTCRQGARPPAPGRAQRGARLTLLRHGPSAAQALRTASGLGWRPWWKTRTPAARGFWHRVCTPTGVNRHMALGPCATPEASRLRNIPSGEEGKEDRVATLALAQHRDTNANTRMRAWTGSAGSAGTRTT